MCIGASFLQLKFHGSKECSGCEAATKCLSQTPIEGMSTGQPQLLVGQVGIPVLLTTSIRPCIALVLHHTDASVASVELENPTEASIAALSAAANEIQSSESQQKGLPTELYVLRDQV